MFKTADLKVPDNSVPRLCLNLVGIPVLCGDGGGAQSGKDAYFLLTGSGSLQNASAATNFFENVVRGARGSDDEFMRSHWIKCRMKCVSRDENQNTGEGELKSTVLPPPSPCHTYPLTPSVYVLVWTDWSLDLLVSVMWHTVNRRKKRAFPSTNSLLVHSLLWGVNEQFCALGGGGVWCSGCLAAAVL